MIRTHLPFGLPQQQLVSLARLTASSLKRTRPERNDTSKSQAIDLWLADSYSFSFSADTDDSDMPSFRAMVTNDGNVTWVIPMITKSSCQISVKNFPLDEQVS